MKFDTVIVVLVSFTIAFLFFVAKDYQKEGSFAESIQIAFGLKAADTAPSPETTLIAPFADPNVKPLPKTEHGYAHLPVNKIQMTLPHRSIRHVSDWLTQHAGNALILDKDKISKLMTEIKPSFTEEAFEKYKAFGKTTNIFSAVFHEENTTLETYLKEDPLSFSRGPVDGVYQWKFEMHMVLNLVKGTLTQYKNTKSSQQHKDVFFCITVARDNSANEDGLLISDWKTGRCK